MSSLVPSKPCFSHNGVRAMKKLAARFINDQSGATAIEYGLIAGLIAVVIISAVSKVGSHLSTKFNIIANNLTGYCDPLRMLCRDLSQ